MVRLELAVDSAQDSPAVDATAAKWNQMASGGKMLARRIASAGIPAAIIFCQATGAALAQEPPPPAAAATPPAVITPMLDQASRSIRLNPLGVSVRIPDSVAVSDFHVSDNFFSLTGDFGYHLTLVEVRFSSGRAIANCEALFAQSSFEKGRFKTPKKGAEFYDSRWYPKYHENEDGWVRFCVDHPGGFITVYSPSWKGKPTGPLLQFTTNLADAFVPQAVQANAAAPVPALHSDINIDHVFPAFVGLADARCEIERRQAQCQYRDQFWAQHKECKASDPSACSAIGLMSTQNEEYGVAAKYFQRACDLGDSASCKRAKDAQRKAK